MCARHCSPLLTYRAVEEADPVAGACLSEPAVDREIHVQVRHDNDSYAGVLVFCHHHCVRGCICRRPFRFREN